MAWRSVCGFHCGSTMKTRLAAGILRLLSSAKYQLAETLPYPNAPVPVVMSNTVVCSFWLKSSKIFCLACKGELPSIRLNGILYALKCRSTKSRVRVQQEKRMLDRVSTSHTRFRTLTFCSTLGCLQRRRAVLPSSSRPRLCGSSRLKVAALRLPPASFSVWSLCFVTHKQDTC